MGVRLGGRQWRRRHGYHHGGPIGGYSTNINANLTATPKPVPVPPAIWLFGSGLMGLAAVARRKKKA